MTRQEVYQHIMAAAKQIQPDDRHSAMSLIVVATAIYAGQEAALAQVLVDFFEHQIVTLSAMNH